MEVFLPWGLFIAAVVAAGMYLELLPEIFARRRFKGAAGVEGALLWLCLIGIVALMAWPFVAASSIHWRRDPSLPTLVLMTFGALAASIVVRSVVQRVVNAYADALLAEDDPVRLMRFAKVLSATITLLLIAFVAGAYWVVHPDIQDCLRRGYC